MSNAWTPDNLKLKANVKRAWLKALRSGDYKQGKEVLRYKRHLQPSDSEYRYCCLGILCDLAAKAGVVIWEGDNVVGSVENIRYVAETTLPYPVYVWAFRNGAKFDDDDISDPKIVYDGKSTTLAGLNDGDTDNGIGPQSFDSIAQVIEDRL